MKYPAVVIVGGGVIGCSIAYYLSKRGVSVTLLERGEIGAQASGAAAGLFSLLKPQAKINPMDAYNHLLFASMELFPTLVAELESATGIELEYAQTGTLRTIHHASRISRLRPWVQACQSIGLPISLLDEAETHELEPLLTPDLLGSIFFPAEGQVRAMRVVEALAQVASEKGAILRSQSEVIGLHRSSSRIVGVLTAHGETIPCDHLVLATGAWAAQCGAWLDLSFPVSPQRGQILALGQPIPSIQHIIIGKGIYVAPKYDNTVIIGATKDDVGFDIQNTAGGIHGLLEAAISLIPALAQSTIERMWAGLRPKTPDNHPILGSAPGWENVTLALGHYSFGILLSAITGQTLAELIYTGKTSELIRPFSLTRFL